MAAGTLISLEEYLSTVYEPDCEYLDGELLERNTGEFDHARLQTIVAALLYGQSGSARVYVFTELRVQISPSRFRIPGITVTKNRGRGKILREPPFLCIEILSPEDRAGRIESKDRRVSWVRCQVYLADRSGHETSVVVFESGRPRIRRGVDHFRSGFGAPVG